MNKKGVSPLVATIIIIGFTIVLALVVNIWGQNYFPEEEFNPETDVCILFESCGVNVCLITDNLNEAIAFEDFWDYDFEIECTEWIEKTHCEISPESENCICDEWSTKEIVTYNEEYGNKADHWNNEIYRFLNCYNKNFDLKFSKLKENDKQVIEFCGNKSEYQDNFETFSNLEWDTRVIETINETCIKAHEKPKEFSIENPACVNKWASCLQSCEFGEDLNKINRCSEKCFATYHYSKDFDNMIINCEEPIEEEELKEITSYHKFYFTNGTSTNFIKVDKEIMKNTNTFPIYCFIDCKDFNFTIKIDTPIHDERFWIPINPYVETCEVICDE